MSRAMPSIPGFVLFPCVVLVDTREQLPLSFAGIKADRVDKGATLIVELHKATLKAGDYSLWGYADRVAIERKSHADLLGTLGKGRDRFERELQRLAEYEFAAVVVEAEWSTILREPLEYSRLSPKTVHRSVIAWQQRFHRVHWHFLPDRRFAEITTFRILERFWKNQQQTKKG